MSYPELLLLVCCVFFLAALIKGIVGFGLPLVGIGLLTAFIGLPSAMALIIFPGLLTNLWQGLSGPYKGEIFRRFWPFFLVTMLFTWPGTLVLVSFNTNYLSALLGISLLAFVTVSVLNPALHIKRQWEPPLNLVLGVISGLLSGMTGAFTVPGVLYFQSVGLTREQLVQSLGMLFSLSTLALAVSLGTNRLLSPELGLTSAIAVIPTFAGLAIGTRLRRKTTEESFRNIFLIALAVLGLYIVIRSLMAIV